MPSVKGLGYELNLTESGFASARRSLRAMRILVMGDFSGRSSGADVASAPRVHERPVVRVDVDNLEEVLWRFAPRLRIAGAGGGDPIELEFRSFEDFRPESIYERVPVFAELREIHRRLRDSATFEEAAGKLQILLGNPPLDVGTETGADESAEEASGESDAEAIERLLGAPASSISAGRAERSEKVHTAVSDLIRRAVTPHVVSERPPQRDVYLRALEDAVGGRMRELLHAPAFQSLEAGWVSLQQLVTNLETDEGLQIHLLDASKQELAADFAVAGGDLRATGLFRLLVEKTGAGTPGGEPWSLLAGYFQFGVAPEDLGLIAGLGMIGAHAGGPFLGAASPELLGCRSLAETPDPSDWCALPPDAEAAWNALRESPVAPWVGLALPRVLLRLPYGKDSEPVETFEFEELGPERRHEDYLWGNPAFTCAFLIGRAYAASGWSMSPGDVLDVGDLPAHVYREGGETHLQACAEAYLSERAATAILDRGIMPLLSFKGRDLVRLARFQSIASPPAALRGSWNG